MTNEYTECALILRGKMDTLYEALENKKTTLSGDYSEDDDSYPTCKAVNEAIGGITTPIVTSWGSTLSDSKVPSEKLTKNTIDTKTSASDVYSQIMTFGNALLTELGTVSDGDDVNY